MSSNPFDYVNAVLQSKKKLIVDDQTEKAYNSFMTNRALSYHMDCLMFANEMNQKHFIDKKMQFDYLLILSGLKKDLLLNGPKMKRM